MTLTELKYIVAVARERHFGKAAEACYVSQPTLSVAVKKLEEELEVKLFERSANEVTVTPLGEEIVRQAQSVLEQAANIKDIAKRGKDPLAGPLKLGVIYTIAPYLLPDLVRQVIQRTPQMPLVLQENFTVKLLEMLRTGEIDCAILAEPFPDTGLASAPLYDEPFLAAVPMNHALASQASVSTEALKKETMLLKLLIERKNEVVSRNQILQSVWGYDVFPSTRTIDNFILAFRKYFEEDPKNPHFFLTFIGF
mgnify:CR=1 FL=1